jgi:AraC-like DNA-binding protein
VFDTRGIVHPSAVGPVFSLQRRPPPPDLACVIENHWIVAWELGPTDTYASEVLPHPCVHLVFGESSAGLYGIPRDRFAMQLNGTGWAIGTRFLPGGLAPFSDHAASALRGRTLELEAAFGAGGAALARSVAALTTGSAMPPVDGTLAAVQAFLRARLPPQLDRRAELVRRIVAEMRVAPPGTTVRELAKRHHIAVRTLQRLFQQYVGVGPKWVLQRYRLHNALEQLPRSVPIDWSRLALELGYADQSHFVRDFRAAVGVTPTRYERDAAIRLAA